MKETPILFSGPMVRAILAGQKTQTRRIVKPALPVYIEEFNERPALDPVLKCVVSGHSGQWEDGHGLDEVRACPYGVPGDRLWVKETFSAHGAFGDAGRKVYRADIPSGKEPHGLHWKPSIFCTRRASRITLEIRMVRVQRLQDISAADACAEGAAEILRRPIDDPLRQAAYARGTWDEKHQDTFAGAVEAYSALWESINGPGSWDANPWVWVIEFRRVEA